MKKSAIKKNYTITLQPSVVDEAKRNLETGQKLSPVINRLLQLWNIQKKKKPIKSGGDKNVVSILEV